MSNIKEKVERYLTEGHLTPAQEGTIADLKRKMDTDDYVVSIIPDKGFALVTFTKKNSIKARYKVFSDKRAPEAV